MNNGLVILVGWLQWSLLVALLVVAILRNVAGHHDDSDVTYERDHPYEPDERG